MTAAAGTLACGVLAAFNIYRGARLRGLKDRILADERAVDIQISVWSAAAYIIAFCGN